MSQTDLFKSLGAPLTNSRRSWGAVRADGVVFLRVWQNETLKIQGKIFIKLTHIEYFQNHDPNNSGYLKRLNHVSMVEDGATTYMIMCEPKDVNDTPRTIKSFNSRELFLGGQILKIDGDTWLEMKARVPVENVRL